MITSLITGKCIKNICTDALNALTCLYNNDITKTVKTIINNEKKLARK